MYLTFQEVELVESYLVSRRVKEREGGLVLYILVFFIHLVFFFSFYMTCQVLMPYCPYSMELS